jgi:nucleoside-diphosphate-sugar epimerase
MRRQALSRREVLCSASALIVAGTIPLVAAAQTPGTAAATAPADSSPLQPERGAQETVLVTGGSGYVGGWCVAELLRRGYTVRTTVRNTPKENEVRSAVATAVDPGERLSFAAADLLRDDGWDAAVAGCDYVLHVASPLGSGDSNDPNSLVAPARDGALRVLRAATKAGVKRVVMTSAATVATPPMSGPDRVNDETVWFDPKEEVDAYRHSKRLAERAAWDFMKTQSGQTTLATVLPGAVLGPLLKVDSSGSTEVVGRLLRGQVPANPHFGLQIVDVRDLVDLHIRAMVSPGAGGERFLGVGEFLWMSEISARLRAHLGEAAEKVPTRNMPDFVFRSIALFDSQLRAMTPRLGRKQIHTSAKAQRLLGWQSRPVTTTLIDCAKSLISKNAI